MRRGLALLAAAVLLAGCSYEPTPVPEPEAAPSPTPAAPPDCTTDESTLASYEPSREGGGAVKEIRDRGRLIVGVSADTYRMAATNPRTGRIEGFDIGIAQRIAEEIFDETFRPGVSLQLKVITAADRIPLLQSGEVDLVVRNMTINCDRWQDIAFSAVYYDAGQKVLLPEDVAPEYGGPEDIGLLAGRRVCAPSGSTSLDNIEEAEPEAVIVPASTHTGCLVKFQRGEVDAITGDDTVLAGLAAQDPYAQVPTQEAFTDEPYGVGANQDDVELVQFVNAVLEEMRADGSWQRLYDQWLRPELGVDGEGATQPEPVTPYRQP